MDGSMENEAMYIECIRKWRELNEYEKQKHSQCSSPGSRSVSSENFAGRVEQVYLAVLEEKRHACSLIM